MTQSLILNTHTMHDKGCDDGGWCDFCFNHHCGDAPWTPIERRGGWEIQSHCCGGIVVEYVPRGYWFALNRVDELDWIAHVGLKNWATPDMLRDLREILDSARKMASE